jgi:hypothetical protein
VEWARRCAAAILRLIKKCKNALKDFFLENGD